MKIRQLMLASAVGAAVAFSAPVLAQIAAGTAVSDPQGGAVGTITAVDGEFVTLKTDRHEVRLPSSSFAKGDKGYVMGMTQADLNAAVDKTMAEANAKMVVGASVKGSAGASVGTIEAIDDQFVTVALAGGDQKVRLPRTAVAATPDGPAIGMTADQLKAAAGGAPAQ